MQNTIIIINTRNKVAADVHIDFDDNGNLSFLEMIQCLITVHSTPSRMHNKLKNIFVIEGRKNYPALRVGYRLIHFYTNTSMFPIPFLFISILKVGYLHCLIVVRTTYL